MKHKIDYNELINHLKEGYQNAQSTIRFIDTKTSIILGLSSTSITLILSNFLSNSVTITNMQVANISPLKIFIVILFIISALCCFISCLLSLIPRKPTKTHISILFPYFSLKKSDKTLSYIEPFCSDFNNEKIVKEYKEQILMVGDIVVKKIFWNRKATDIFILQLIFMLFILFFLFL